MIRRTLALTALTFSGALALSACDLVSPSPEDLGPHLATPAGDPTATAEKSTQNWQLEIEGVTFQAGAATQLFPARDGAAVGVQSSGSPSGGSRVHLSADDPADLFATQLVRGIVLDEPGETFQVEISGVSAGHQGGEPESLVINLSLGWNALGLAVAGDYPSGCGSATAGTGYTAYASCRGALVVAARADLGDSILAFRSSDGYRGFRLKSIHCDPRLGVFDLSGDLIDSTRKARSVRVLMRMEHTCDASVYSHITMEQGPVSSVPGPQPWFVAPDSAPNGDPEELPEIAG